MGPSRRPDSTRARKARPPKSSSPPAPKDDITQLKGLIEPPGRKPSPRIPAAIEIAIEAQRNSLETAISLLYCLHSAMRREIDDAGKIESDAVEAASKSADLTDLSAMLLVQLDAIDRALDPEELAEADLDPEMVAIAEAARKMRGDPSDEEDAS